MGRLHLFALFATAPLLAACAGANARAQPRVYTAVADDMPSAGPAVPPVYLVLDAERGAVLQRLSTRDHDWKDVCLAPCYGYVPAFGSYRVSDGSRPPTEPFTLPGPPGTSVVLKVDDDGKVWTRDSVDLRSRRASYAAGAGAWLAVWGLLRR